MGTLVYYLVFGRVNINNHSAIASNKFYQTQYEYHGSYGY